MGEPALEVDVNKPSVKYFENAFDFVTENTSYIDCIKHLIQSLESNDIHNGLIAYSNAFYSYISDFLNFECLEIFIESLIVKARETISSNNFDINYFLCFFCGDIINDPVTLKCGHTFSKKCILQRAKNGPFNCIKCSENYSLAYLSHLKNNIVVSEIIQKVWNFHIDFSNFKSGEVADCDCTLRVFFTNIITSEADSLISFQNCRKFVENPSPKSFLEKGNLLVSMGRLKEAVYLYLIYCVFVPGDVQIKTKSIKILHKLLLKCPGITKTSEKKLFLSKSYRRAKTESFPSEDEFNVKSFNESLKNYDMYLLINQLCCDIEKLSVTNFFQKKSGDALFKKQEFECSLCMQLFLEPVTTPCGHTFCRNCLYRSLDHQAACPLCKTSLMNYFGDQAGKVNEFLELAIIVMFPDEYTERKSLFVKELEAVFNPNRMPNPVLPLFVCTVAYPNMPCPLHIFEPRYRLMIRQSIETGTCKFGMCAFIDNEISEFGTVVEIEDVRYFPDGRSVVNATGGRRFRVVSKGQHFGYNTATFEYLTDEVLEVDDEFREFHDVLYKTSKCWFTRLSQDTKLEVLKHFGPMPEKEENFFSKPDGPSWFWWILAVLPIDQKLQVLIISMTSFARRLAALSRIFMQLE